MCENFSSSTTGPWMNQRHSGSETPTCSLQGHQSSHPSSSRHPTSKNDDYINYKSMNVIHPVRFPSGFQLKTGHHPQKFITTQKYQNIRTFWILWWLVKRYWTIVFTCDAIENVSRARTGPLDNSSARVFQRASLLLKDPLSPWRNISMFQMN